ncbi:alanine--tRNA ligase, partial [Patescibacteria group bacterium]|nr:alanine--tRNA ligase [Patescibacteria group bacterium]MBU1890473.1 alanine--tRNA ligase [Patescibacteria group bacterium]
MNAEELRKKYIEFFKEKGHAEIPSASLIPENDPSVLFTTAGMHPLVPFLLGEKHPSGNRLVNCQRCIRTSDIEYVGDDTHLTFFEMLGNWSLGDPDAPDGVGAGYFRKEAIEWSWEFLTDKKWLGLDKDKISVSVFQGDEDAPKDEESAKLWESVGIPKDRIFYYGKEDNWWGPAGKTGPCGPDTEMFFDTGKECKLDKGSGCQPSCPCGRYVEIWNDVFMEYNKTADGKYEPLKQKNIDTGMGLERTIQAVNGFENVYEIKLLAPLMQLVKNESEQHDEIKARIIVDHIKAAVILIGDGVKPSNLEHGYVVRRLIRRAYRLTKQLDIYNDTLLLLARKVIEIYSNTYKVLVENEKNILETLDVEINKFSKTLDRGLKIFQKELEAKGHQGFSGKVAFDLYQTYGFPKEMIADELRSLGTSINEQEWQEAEQGHKKLSRQGSDKKFAGGLAEQSEKTIRLHTATHLLHQALRNVLGDHVEQRGSNITEERLRFDFTHPEKISNDKLRRVEEIVNEKIKEEIPIDKKVMPIEEAKKLGAIG